MKLFIDTNVLIDFILQRIHFYGPAASIFSYASDGKVDVAVSSITVVNANYICLERCKMPESVYRKKIDFLRGFLTIYDVNESDIYKSYDNKWKDFEDGVQYYCAVRNKADYIVTRNGMDFEGRSITSISPDEAIDIIESDLL